MRRLRLNPDYPYALGGVCAICKEKGNLALAIAYFNRAVGLDPKFAVGFLQRGNAYKDKGSMTVRSRL